MSQADTIQPEFEATRSVSDAGSGPRKAVGTAERKRANDLDGRTWTRYSISIWSDIRKSKEELHLGHPATFPIALVTRLIQVFASADDRVVLDPFVGVGTTALAAKRLGKHGIGIELSPEYVEVARERCESQTFFDVTGGAAVIHCADAMDLDSFVERESVDLVVTSPPYWDVLTEKRTADYKEIRNYGSEARDLGRIPGYRDFLLGLKEVFVKVYAAMRTGAYCCVIVMDLRKKDKFFPFHSDVARFMEEIGFIYDDLIIWDRRHDYNNMRPLGYPSVFRVNKAHEFILIFKKPFDQR